MTTASHALEFTTGDIPLRPGFGERLANWMKARKTKTEMPEFDARALYDMGFTDIADPTKLEPLAVLEPHVVLGRMMWMGVR